MLGVRGTEDVSGAPVARSVPLQGDMPTMPATTRKLLDWSHCSLCLHDHSSRMGQVCCHWVKRLTRCGEATSRPSAECQENSREQLGRLGWSLGSRRAASRLCKSTDVTQQQDGSAVGPYLEGCSGAPETMFRPLDGATREVPSE
jgi:hypothetical protein